MATAVFTAPSSTPARIADWVLRGLLGLTFLAAGGAKLAGIPAMVTAFDEIGFGQWFRYFTGAWEAVGGALILVPRWSVGGAFLLACAMTGAVLTNIFLISGGDVIPPGILLILSLAALWLRRPAFS